MEKRQTLELAKRLEAVPFIGFVFEGQEGVEDPSLCREAASELRRLHTENERLVKLLADPRSRYGWGNHDWSVNLAARQSL